MNRAATPETYRSRRFDGLAFRVLGQQMRSVLLQELVLTRLRPLRFSTYINAE